MPILSQITLLNGFKFMIELIQKFTIKDKVFIFYTALHKIFKFMLWLACKLLKVGSLNGLNFAN